MLYQTCTKKVLKTSDLEVISQSSLRLTFLLTLGTHKVQIEAVDETMATVAGCVTDDAFVYQSLEITHTPCTLTDININIMN